MHLTGRDSLLDAQPHPRYRFYLDQNFNRGFADPTSPHASSLLLSSSLPVEPIAEPSSSTSVLDPPAPSGLLLPTPQSNTLQLFPTFQSGSGNPGLGIQLAHTSSHQLDAGPAPPVIHNNLLNIEDSTPSARIIGNMPLTTSSEHHIPALLPHFSHSSSGTAPQEAVDTFVAGDYDCDRVTGSKKSHKEYSRGRSTHRNNDRRTPHPPREDSSQGKRRSRSYSGSISSRRSSRSDSGDRRRDRGHDNGGIKSGKERKRRRSPAKSSRTRSRSRSRSPVTITRRQNQSSFHSNRNQYSSNEQSTNSRASSASVQGSSSRFDSKPFVSDQSKSTRRGRPAPGSVHPPPPHGPSRNRLLTSAPSTSTHNKHFNDARYSLDPNFRSRTSCTGKLAVITTLDTIPSEVRDSREGWFCLPGRLNVEKVDRAGGISAVVTERLGVYRKAV